MILLSIVFFLIFLGLAISFLMAMNSVLTIISPANRRTEPSSVWLMLIPLFNLVWQFILYKKLTDSITAEYRSKGLTDTADRSYKIGMIAASCLAGSTVIGAIWDERSAGQSILSLIGLIAWIALWVQVNNHRKRLIELRNRKDADSLIFND